MTLDSGQTAHCLWAPPARLRQNPGSTRSAGGIVPTASRSAVADSPREKLGNRPSNGLVLVRTCNGGDHAHARGSTQASTGSTAPQGQAAVSPLASRSTDNAAQTGSAHRRAGDHCVLRSDRSGRAGRPAGAVTVAKSELKNGQLRLEGQSSPGVFVTAESTTSVADVRADPTGHTGSRATTSPRRTARSRSPTAAGRRPSRSPLTAARRR